MHGGTFMFATCFHKSAAVSHIVSMEDSIPAATDESVLASLAAKLLDPASPLPLKYRVLFSLRNLPGEAARAALASGGGTSERNAADIDLTEHARVRRC